MLCPNCETMNRENAKFCDQCGFPLTGAIAQAAFGDLLEDGSPDGADPVEEGDVLQDVEDDVDDENPQPEDLDLPEEDLEPEGLEEDGYYPEDFEDEEYLPEEQYPDFDQTQVIMEGDQEEPQYVSDADMTAFIGPNLMGIDHQAEDYGERYINPDYAIPETNYRDGHTMQMPRVETDEAPKGRDFLASSTTTQQKKRVKPILTALAVIVVLAAVATFATYQMELWGGKAIPDVIGMTEADARSVLEEQGFLARSTQVKSDETEGLVLLMDPTAGRRAEEGDEVVIHIATARCIPNIVGMKQEKAEAAMKEEGYDNITFEPERSDAEEGTVLTVSPEAGTRAKSTLPVVVKIAQAYVVPEVAQMNVNDAGAAVKEAGLRYDISYVDTETVPEGTVMGVEPAAGTKVKSDTIVMLSVARARGAQLVRLTQDMLSPGSTVNIDGVSYEIESLGSVEYLGNDTVSFSFEGRPFTYFIGQYVSLDSRTVTGQVVWTPDNGVAEII